MTGIFLSYAHPDADAAVALASSLEDAGYHVFRDRDAEHGIPAGTRWAQELFTSLDRAEVVVLLASPASLRSPWCHTELATAVARGKHVVQVGLGAAGNDVVPVHRVLTEVQALAPASTVAALAAALVRDLSRTGFAPGDPFSWDPDRSPYPGLQRLTEDHAAVLFGRDGEIAAVMERLLRPRPEPVLVVGPSGSGKSSMVRAGVLSRLGAQARTTVLPSIEPGTGPLRRFAAALVDVEPTLDHRRLIEEPSGIAEAVDRLTARGGRLVACLDQCEDLLLPAAAAETQALVERLAGIERERLALVVVLRSASLDAWGRHPLLGPWCDANPVWVPPLTRSALRDVIVGPARLAGIRFEPAQLVERILDDTGEGHALPLLAALLEELTEQHSRTAPAVVTAQRYDSVGPVRRVVERRASVATDQLSGRGLSEAEVVRAYLRLVDLDQELQPIRAELEASAVSGAQLPVFEAFEQNRLVIRDRRIAAAGPGSAADVGPRPQSVEVGPRPQSVEVILPVHEEVFRAWPALATAIDVQRSDLEVRSWLRRESQDWERSDEGAVPLTGGRLDLAVDWSQRHPDETGESIARFVRAAQRQRRQRRLFTIATPLLTAVVLVVAVLAGLLARQVGISDAARADADGLRLASQARAVSGTRPDLGLLLALEAAARGTDVQAVAAPLVALSRGPGPVGYAQLPAAPLAAALDAAGRRAVVSTTSGTLFWDVATAHPLGTVPGTPTALAVSGDGQRVALAVNDRVEIRPWLGASPSCAVDAAQVEQLRLSRTGNLLLAVSVDRTRQPPSSIVTVVDGQDCRTRRWPTVNGLVTDAALDEDADVAALTLGPRDADSAPGIQFWQLRTGRPQFAAAGAQGRLTAVALAGEQAAALDDQGGLRVWRWRLPDQAPWTVSAFAAHGQALRALSTSSAGTGGQRWLAVGSAGELRVVRTGEDPPGLALLASLPPLGTTDDDTPCAVAAAAGAAVLLDRSGRIVTWDLDRATALGAPVEAGHRLDAVVEGTDAGAIAIGPDGVWVLPAGGPSVRHPLVGASALAADGQTWAVGTNQGDVLRAPNPGAAPQVVARLPAGVAGVAVLRDGRVAAVDVEGHLVVTGSGAASAAGSSRAGETALGVAARSLATDGRYLFVGDAQRTGAAESDLLVVDSQDPALPAVRYGSNGSDTSAIAVSRDGSMLATGGDDRRIIVWELHDGRPIPKLHLDGHDDRVTSLAFAPDGTRLASAGEDRAVILWQLSAGLATGEALGEPITVPTIASVAFLPAGRSGDRAAVMLGVVGNGLARWPTSSASWQTLACAIVGRRVLSAEERQQYLRGEAPRAHCG